VQEADQARLRVIAQRIAAVVVCVGALEIVCRAGWVSPATLIAPSAMVVAMIRALGDPATLGDFGLTLSEVAAATAVAAAVGVVAGLALHALPRIRYAFEPLIASYYALPLFALYPVLVVIFGVGPRPIIATGVLYAAMSVVVGTLAGLDRVPAVFRKAAKVHRLGPLKTATRILVPACAPEILGGIALSVGYAFVAVIASEFLLASAGIGHAIADAYNTFQTARMYGLVLALALLVVIINSALRRFRSHLAVGRP
jgi:NitT/TauT family transport system permease protein